MKRIKDTDKHCHYINIDTNFPPCPKCETMKFSQAIREQGDVTYYYAVCDNCQLQTLLGYYVSTIKSCEDGACKL
jgi:transcription elongation factor Elf1